MNVKEIRNELMTVKNVRFSVRDKKFRMVCLEDGNNRAVTNNIYQMNVSKFGPTCLTLYTFDMLSNKTVGKIKYANVKLISYTVEVESDGEMIDVERNYEEAVS